MSTGSPPECTSQKHNLITTKLSTKLPNRKGVKQMPFIKGLIIFAVVVAVLLPFFLIGYALNRLWKIVYDWAKDNKDRQRQVTAALLLPLLVGEM